MNQWKDSILNPATSTLQSGFEQLGIDGETWASEAAIKLLDGLFETFTEYSYEGVGITTTNLKNNWETILNDALSGAEEAVNAESYGKDTVDGYNKGIKDNAATTNEAINKWMNDIPKTIHDSNMNFGSPSKTAKEYGKWTVEGFNDGIAENIESTKELIKTWMDVVCEIFSAENCIEKFEGIKEAFVLKWQEIMDWFNSDFIPTWFEEGIMPWFSYEKWYEEILINVPLAFQTMWEEVLSWWNDEAMTTWWTNYVVPWFTVEKWYIQFKNIHTALKKTWEEIVETWNLLLDKWWKENVLPRFTYDKWKNMLLPTRNAFKNNFEEIVEIIEEKMQEAYESVSDWCSKMSSEIDGVLSKISQIESKIASLGGISIGISTTGGVSIPKFATGGFPEDGLFYANYNELVGQFSNGRTAVANNEQITEGIKQGVKEAVSEILAPYLAEIAQNTRETADKDFDVSLDGRSLIDSLNQRSVRNGYSFT